MTVQGIRSMLIAGEELFRELLGMFLDRHKVVLQMLYFIRERQIILAQKIIVKVSRGNRAFSLHANSCVLPCLHHHPLDALVLVIRTIYASRYSEDAAHKSGIAANPRGVRIDPYSEEPLEAAMED